MSLVKGFRMRLCHYGLQKMYTQLVNFVMHIFDRFVDFYISLFIVNHLQLNLEEF